MKKLLFLAFAFTTTCIANAQKPNVGFTAGTAISNYTIKEGGTKVSEEPVAGITAGILFDISTGKNISFQPALNFTQKGAKNEETYMGTTEKYKVSVSAIELLLNILYNVSAGTGNFFIGAGPSLAFAVSGKSIYDDGTTKEKEDLKFGNNENEDDIKGMDFGANILAGYRFANRFQISGQYNAGLSNLMPGGSDDESLKSHYFGIKLGWMLKKKK